MLLLSSKERNKNIKLKVQEYNSSRELVKFENYDDVESAKKLTNQQLFASEDETKENCSLEKDQYFWFDIMDCKIIEDNFTTINECGYLRHDVDKVSNAIVKYLGGDDEN